MFSKNRSALLAPALVLFLSGAAPAAFPEASFLLEKALHPAEAGYHGRLSIIEWYGQHTQAEEVEIYHAPGRHVRREFISPDGTVGRVVVENDALDEGSNPADESLSIAAQRDLILRNYRLSVLGSDVVAGHKTWGLEFDPLVSGKPWLKLWVDPETGVILETRRYLPGRRLATVSRFTYFELRDQFDEDLFRADAGSATVPSPSPAVKPLFPTPEALVKALGRRAAFPRELPGGFVFEGGEVLAVGKAKVGTARYTDGLSAVSVFETDRPVRVPKEGTTLLADSAHGRAALRVTMAGQVLSVRRGRAHYTLMSDISRELLLSIAEHLKVK